MGGPLVSRVVCRDRGLLSLNTLPWLCGCATCAPSDCGSEYLPGAERRLRGTVPSTPSPSGLLPLLPDGVRQLCACGGMPWREQQRRGRRLLDLSSQLEWLPKVSSKIQQQRT